MATNGGGRVAGPGAATNDERLQGGDAAKITGEGVLRLAAADAAELLLVDTPL